jgi:hypothetical protein
VLFRGVLVCCVFAGWLRVVTGWCRSGVLRSCRLLRSLVGHMGRRGGERLGIADKKRARQNGENYEDSRDLVH